MSSKIKAYFMRVGKETGQIYRGYFGELENTLRAKQDYVGYDEPGNLIQVIRLTEDIDVVMNDEGKLKGYPLNRAILSVEGQVLDVIVGNCVCLRHNDEGDFISIEESDKDIIERQLVPVLTILGNTIVLEHESKLPEYKEE